MHPKRSPPCALWNISEIFETLSKMARKDGAILAGTEILCCVLKDLREFWRNRVKEQRSLSRSYAIT